MTISFMEVPPVCESLDIHFIISSIHFIVKGKPCPRSRTGGRFGETEAGAHPAQIDISRGKAV